MMLLYIHIQRKESYHTMSTLTVNGIDFNVEIDTDFGEIEVTDVHGNQVAFAEVCGNTEQGSYIIYDENGEVEDEKELPREIHDNLAYSDGLSAAHWLCSISFD